MPRAGSDHLRVIFRRGDSGYGPGEIRVLDYERLDDDGNVLLPATEPEEPTKEVVLETDGFTLTRHKRPERMSSFEYAQEISGDNFTYRFTPSKDDMPEDGIYVFEGFFFIHSSRSYEGEWDEEDEWDGTWRGATPEEIEQVEEK